MIISKNSKLNLLFKAYGYWLYKRKLANTQYNTLEKFKAFQLSEVKKIEKADFVINNFDQALIPQVKIIYDEIIK